MTNVQAPDLGYIGFMVRWFFPVFALLWFTGCASKLPSAISQPPEQPVSVRQVQGKPDQYRSRTVRWGGEILEVQNRSEHTDVLVLGRALKKSGEPREEGEVEGRFIARFSGFLDPGQLPKGRLLTVSGPVIGVEERKVGEYPYRYPVVQVVAWHLWPKPQPRYYYRDPWWPYYPWYPYPYWW
jgi:outer membrane lipoprotein